jgi:general secretion pathway protein K
MKTPPVRLKKQRGVAIVTALLLTTLAVTIVASLFWQQQVQVRSIENQRLQLQKEWILRGALDWSRLILREDALYSRIDTLGEPWAVTLAETRLDQYVQDNGATNGENPDAVLSGGIVDAQSRLNLANLSQSGQVDPVEVAAFARLLTLLQLNPSLAQATATTMAAGQKSTTTTGTTSTTTTSTGTSSMGQSSQPLGITQVDDLLAVPGFTPAMLDRLRDFVIVLPRTTPVNVNTAPAEVLSARVGTLSLAEATALVAARDKAYFKDTADFAQRSGVTNASGIDVATSYFLINGNVRLNRAAMKMQSLIERNGTNTKVIWIREN